MSIAAYDTHRSATALFSRGSCLQCCDGTPIHVSRYCLPCILFASVKYWVMIALVYKSSQSVLRYKKIVVGKMDVERWSLTIYFVRVDQKKSKVHAQKCSQCNAHDDK
jgi:hypothetical protein